MCKRKINSRIWETVKDSKESGVPFQFDDKCGIFFTGLFSLKHKIPKSIKVVPAILI